MDTGQPLVISKGMLNYLHDHRKVYYTYIGMYIQRYMHYYMWHMGTAWGEFLFDSKTRLSCYQKDSTSSWSVSVHPH